MEGCTTDLNVEHLLRCILTINHVCLRVLNMVKTTFQGLLQMYITDQDRQFDRLSVHTKYHILKRAVYARRHRFNAGIFHDTNLEIDYIRPYHKRKKFLFEKVIYGYKNIMSSIRRIYQNAYKIWTIRS